MQGVPFDPTCSWTVAALRENAVNGNDNGTSNIYTLLESCRRRGINQREYLFDVIARLPAMKITEMAELTSAHWLAGRAAAQNQAA